MFKFFKRKIKLESFEVRIIINSLKAMRNKLIENKELNYIKDLMMIDQKNYYLGVMSKKE